jgi:hypothetical protein
VVSSLDQPILPQIFKGALKSRNHLINDVWFVSKRKKGQVDSWNDDIVAKQVEVEFPFQFAVAVVDGG